MKFFLASHGKMASGMKNSLDVLLGESSKLVSYDAYLDDSDPKEALEDFFSTVKEDETVVLLSDIYGGSVNQNMVHYIDRPNTYLVSGINLAFLLELFLKETIDEEVIDEVIASSREALQRVVLEPVEDEDESFF